MSNGDEKRDLIDPAAETGVQTPAEPVAVNPWAEAFDSLAEPAAEPADGDTPETTPGPDVAAGDTDATGGVRPEGEHAAVGSVDAGGSLPADGESGGSDESFDPTAIEETLGNYTKSIESQAIADTAQLFIDQTDDQGRKAIRQTDGKLGATINDADIYRVDPSTGVATFYNPDTGRPFAGDNPRKQAKAWVEDYNEELRETFNKYTEQRKKQLETAAAPVIELMKFVPTYESLDSTRQQMLDALIEDYSVYDDSGDHIGYSVDLNQALAQVNRQIAAIQQTAQKKPPTGPAVDMPSSGSGNNGIGKPITSLADAMEAQQNAQLDKLRNR